MAERRPGEGHFAPDVEMPKDLRVDMGPAAGMDGLYSDPLTGPAEDANRLQAVREVATRRHLYTDLGHYADAVDQALDGPHTQGEDA